MRVRAFNVLEDCFDSDLVREAELEGPIDEGLIEHLAAQGEMQYFPDFPRPYFRLRIPALATIQGLLGETVCRVTSVRSADADIWGRIATLFEQEKN